MLPRARFLYALSAYIPQKNEHVEQLAARAEWREGGCRRVSIEYSPSDFHGDRCAACARPAIHGVCWLSRQTFSMMRSMFAIERDDRDDDLQPILDGCFALVDADEEALLAEF